MNLDNVINKLNSVLTELEELEIPANEIEKIKFHLLNTQKVTNEVAAELAPDLLYEKIKQEITAYNDSTLVNGCYKEKLAICISTNNFNLIKGLNYVFNQNVIIYSVNDLPDNVITIGIR